jgi:hypothetical protein
MPGKEALRCRFLSADDFANKRVFCDGNSSKTANCRSQMHFLKVLCASIESIGRSARLDLFAVGQFVGLLGQVLSQDHSCRAAVTRLIAHRVSRGQQPCSAETGAYCQARKRISEEFFATVARKTGQALDNNAKQHWLWKGRRVLAYDGSTVSMPDTPENQRAYPQPPQQLSGLGFPLARMAAFFSLSCGAVLDLAICSNYGKGHSELGMLHKLWEVLRPGDIMLADRYMCAWHEIYLLKQRGIDTVTRVHHCRRVDFRCGAAGQG